MKDELSENPHTGLSYLTLGVSIAIFGNFCQPFFEILKIHVKGRSVIVV